MAFAPQVSAWITSPVLLALVLGLIGVAGLLTVRQRREFTRAQEERDIYGSTTKDVKIKSLFIHPIKSCGYISLNESEYDASGLRYDRTWLIINADNKRFNTARDLPQIVLIRPSLHPETNELKIRIPFSKAPDEKEATVVSTPLNPSAEFLNSCEILSGITIWAHSQQDGYAVSKEADDALTRFFGRDVRLVRKGPTPRVTQGEEADPDGTLARWGTRTAVSAQDLDKRSSVRFQDFLPMLIATDASMEHLRQSLLRSIHPSGPIDSQDEIVARTVGKGEYEIKSWSLPLQKIDTSVWTPEYIHQLPINRYRPNVLLTSSTRDDGEDGHNGTSPLVGFEEDNWAHLEVFSKDAAAAKPPPYGLEAEGKGKGIFCLARCGRCTVPSIDLETGKGDPILPARVLQRYRIVDVQQPYKVCFGMLSTPRETAGVLHVGDTVRVTRCGVRPVLKKPSPGA